MVNDLFNNLNLAYHITQVRLTPRPLKPDIFIPHSIGQSVKMDLVSRQTMEGVSVKLGEAGILIWYHQDYKPSLIPSNPNDKTLQ